MIIGRINGANLVLGKPVDWDESKGVHCGSLPVLVEDTVVGRMMTSAWFPTPDELKLLQEGRPIYLTVWGTGHPPVGMSVQP